MEKIKRPIKSSAEHSQHQKLTYHMPTHQFSISTHQCLQSHAEVPLQYFVERPQLRVELKLPHMPLGSLLLMFIGLKEFKQSLFQYYWKQSQMSQHDTMLLCCYENMPFTLCFILLPTELLDLKFMHFSSRFVFVLN